METVETVVAGLRDWIEPLGEAEHVPVQEAIGRVLAAPLAAPRDVPFAPLSLFDGYAVAGPLADGDAAVVVGKQFAGDPPSTLEPGSAMRIFTGALLPAGADTVIAQESVERDGDRVTWTADVSRGDGVRQTGADTRAGETLLEAGARVSPAMLGLIASTGLAEVAVSRRVRVALLTTGDELLAPGDPFAPGKIYDANGPMLACTGANCSNWARMPFM